MNTTDVWLYDTHIQQQPFSPFNTNTDVYTTTNSTIDIISILFDEIEKDTSISINHKDKNISLSFYDINIDNTNDINIDNNNYDSLSPSTPLNTTLSPPRRKSDFIERFKNQEKVSKVSIYICICLLYITRIYLCLYTCIRYVCECVCVYVYIYTD